MNLNMIISVVAVALGLLYAFIIIRTPPERNHKRVVSFLRRRALEVARRKTTVVALFSADLGCDGVAEAIANQIKQDLKRVYFNGIGGSYLSKVNMVDMRVGKYSSIGYGGAFGWLPIIPKLALKINEIIKEERPQLVVLFSNPGVNIRVAKQAHRRNIPVAYVFPPETWAYEFPFLTRRTNKAVLKYVDRMYVNFEFEKEYWDELKKKLGGTTEIKYLGQPFLDMIPRELVENANKNSYRKELRAKLLGINEAPWVVGLLPGSRLREIKVHLPIILGAAAQIAKDTKYKNSVKWLLPTAEESLRPLIKRIVNQFESKEGLQVKLCESKERYKAILVCDLLLCSSGTATLEAAYFGVPSIVVYKAPLLDRILFGVGLIKLKEQYVSLANILVEHTADSGLSQAVCPEIIRGVVPKTVATEAMNILGNSKLLREKREILLEATHAIRHNPSAAKGIAKDVIQLVKSSS